MSVFRYDKLGSVNGRPRVGADGMLRVPARIARVGVQEYRKADGTMQRELRPPEEVFHPDSLASYSQVVVTLDHPPEPVEAKNAKVYQRGATSETVTNDADTYVATKLLVSDALAVKAVEDGTHREVSCGYTCDLDFTPGEWRGQKYDAVQRNIRGNHVALVPKGRAGPEVKLRLDSASADAVLRHETSDDVQPKESTMPRLKLDGAEHEIPDALLAPVKAEIAAVKADAEAKGKAAAAKIEGERDAEKARADKAEADLAALKKDAEGKVTADEAIKAYKARAELEGVAERVTGTKADVWQGKPDRVVHADALAKLLPDVKLDGKSDEYVAAAFDTAVASWLKQDHAGAARRASVAPPEGDKKNDSAEPKSVERMDADRREELRTSHLRPTGFTLESGK